ncbi:tubulin binding cofactor A, partial [Ceraceosorus guamensis]
EEETYVQEAKEQEERVERLQKQGADEWDVKKQREVLRDCEQMIPDCKKRLDNAVSDLEAFLVSLRADASVGESQEAKTAREVLDGVTSN